MRSESHRLGEEFFKPMPSTRNAPIVTETFKTEWPEPEPLEPELPEVNPFDEDLLPVSFRALVMDASERMQAPADFAAAIVVVALAACVGRRARIQPKLHDSGWQVIPNLSGGVVGPPGRLKTPMLNAIIEPLKKIEKEWRREYQEALPRYEEQKEEHEVEHQAWKEMLKAAIKNKEERPKKTVSDLIPPVEKQLILNDATFEALHETLRDNPAGIFLLRDEMVGWLAGLDKEGREGERYFYLEAWDGNSGYKMKRITRGTVHSEAICVSLFGNIQPGPLSYYLTIARDNTLSDDGLFQRLQVLVWPDEERDWQDIDRAPDAVAIMRAEKVFSVLANLPEGSIQAHFDPPAQALFKVWLGKLEHRIRNNPELLPPAVISHLAKYRSLMPSLALLFELADRVASDEPLTAKLTVSHAHAQQAAAFCSYLESHAHRVYGCLTSPAAATAHRVAKRLKRGDLGETFTTRSLHQKNWSGLTDIEQIRAGLELLKAANWLRQEEKPVSLAGGRPPETWTVNPGVLREK